MKSINRTDSEVYHLGIDALINNLGTTGASRFLNQIRPPAGNYTLERHKWLDNLPDIDTLAKQIRQVSKEFEAERIRISKLKADICENRKPQATFVQKITDDDLYRLGLELLIDKLGLGEMSRFLRLCAPGYGTYAVDRYKNSRLIEQTCKTKQKRVS